MPRKPSHTPLNKITFTFDVPGPTIVALYNAMGFTIAHRDLYKKEADDCEHCFDAMQTLAEYFINLIDSSTAAKLPRKKLN